MADKLKKEKGAEIGGEAGFGSLPSETNEEKIIIKENGRVKSKNDSAYLQHPVIDKVKPRPKPSKEAGTNTYAKDNQKTIKKLKA